MAISMDQTLAQTAEQQRSRYFGKYRGLVQDVNDPESMGRITAKVPAVYGDEVSPWALPASPFAGSQHGFLALPEQNDGVWMEFEAGDPSRPIWSGFWWGSNEMPSPNGPLQRVWVTSQGLKIVLDDDSKKLQLLHPGGGEITMTDNDITIKIGSAQIVLSSSGVSINNGAIEVST
jgi:hypothetical protein